MSLRPLVALGLLLTASGAIAQDAPDRQYHQVELRALAAGKVRRTHVLVEGYVAFVKIEEDGDRHIRLCDSASVTTMDRKRCVVLECIPELPCPAPKVGDHIAVAGISRFDPENGHRWYELHPVLKGYW